jgi:hypothetical protein
MQIASVSQVPDHITFVPPTTTKTHSTHHSLTSLCQQWGKIREDSLPGICHHFVVYDDTSYSSPVHHHSDSLEAEVVRQGFATGRNISIAAVLAGVLFILLIIAVVMRIRQSKTGQVRINNRLHNIYNNICRCSAETINVWHIECVHSTGHNQATNYSQP